jgi:hypothetical protein
MRTAVSYVNVRSIFLNNEDIKLRVMKYTDCMTVGEILQPCYRGFLTRLVCRVLREELLKRRKSDQQDLSGEILDFMG